MEVKGRVWKVPRSHKIDGIWVKGFTLYWEKL
jgi:hypothetical protein